MMFSLQGKTAVVTGGASGIGRATVKRFAEAGAYVVIADLTDASDLAAEVKGRFVRTDVSDEEQVARLMATAAEASGRVDIAVNNAGVVLKSGFVQDVDIDAFERGYRVNLMSAVYGVRHAARHMAAGGSILNTASVAGVQGAPSYSPYVAAKAAIIGVTRTAALELAPRNIRVNCVCPATVDTPMAYAEGAEAELRLSTMMMPLGRLCRAEEVAALFHFLAADDCSFVTGQAICIDGGMTAGPSLGMVIPLLLNL